MINKDKIKKEEFVEYCKEKALEYPGRFYRCRCFIDIYEKRKNKMQKYYVIVDYERDDEDVHDNCKVNFDNFETIEAAEKFIKEVVESHTYKNPRFIVIYGERRSVDIKTKVDSVSIKQLFRNGNEKKCLGFI